LVLVKQAGGRDVLVVAYFGPEEGQLKGQNPAVSGAKDGEANEAKRIFRLPADRPSSHNLDGKHKFSMLIY
jgi:hypothetical protein